MQLTRLLKLQIHLGDSIAIAYGVEYQIYVCEAGASS